MFKQFPYLRKGVLILLALFFCQLFYGQKKYTIQKKSKDTTLLVVNQKVCDTIVTNSQYEFLEIVNNQFVIMIDYSPRIPDNLCFGWNVRIYEVNDNRFVLTRREIFNRDWEKR